MSALSRPGPSARLLATLLAVSLPLGALPGPAAAAGPHAGVYALAGAPAGKLSASEAAGNRKPAQDKAEKMLAAGSADEAAELLRDEADKTADPVLYIDAAEAYKAAGLKNKSRVDLENGMESARVGLDILYFLQDPRADPDWQPVDQGKVAAEISRGEKAIEACEQAVDEISKKDEPTPVVEDKERKKAPRDGRGLIAGGAVLTVIGVAGLAMIGAGTAISASTQKDVDALDLSMYTKDELPGVLEPYDKKGDRANLIAYVGIPVAVVGLATGIALLAVGVKKRKRYRAENGDTESTSASLRVLPTMGRNYGGFALSGRF
ncbi:MAG: hypothetical protein JNL82_11100 [Myxococcales bacterium]|nr:hypothetical protein [Myxococcales bacterium]